MKFKIGAMPCKEKSILHDIEYLDYFVTAIGKKGRTIYILNRKEFRLPKKMSTILFFTAPDSFDPYIKERYEILL